MFVNIHLVSIAKPKEGVIISFLQRLIEGLILYYKRYEISIRILYYKERLYLLSRDYFLQWFVI